MRDFMENGEPLAFLAVIAVNDDDVFAFDLSRLAGFIIVQVMDDLNPGVRSGGEELKLDWYG
jgi:hypothetical protein